MVRNCLNFNSSIFESSLILSWAKVNAGDWLTIWEIWGCYLQYAPDTCGEALQCRQSWKEVSKKSKEEEKHKGKRKARIMQMKAFLANAANNRKPFTAIPFPPHRTLCEGNTILSYRQLPSLKINVKNTTNKILFFCHLTSSTMDLQHIQPCE